MKQILVLVSLVMFTGCAGRLYTIKDPKPDARGRIEGLIVYQPKNVILVTETTHLQDKKGNIVGSAEQGTCEPVPAYELTTMTDYDRPYAVGYDAALFESHNLTLDLDKGVLTKINSESKSAAKEALDALSGTLTAAKEVMTTMAAKSVVDISQMEGKVKPACNTGKKVVGRKDFSDIPKK